MQHLVSHLEGEFCRFRCASREKQPQLSHLVGDQRLWSYPGADGSKDGTRRAHHYSPRAGWTEKAKEESRVELFPNLTLYMIHLQQ